jgi:hypothetical protein
MKIGSGRWRPTNSLRKIFVRSCPMAGRQWQFSQSTEYAFLQNAIPLPNLRSWQEGHIRMDKDDQVPNAIGQECESATAASHRSMIHLSVLSNERPGARPRHWPVQQRFPTNTIRLSPSANSLAEIRPLPRVSCYDQLAPSVTVAVSSGHTKSVTTGNKPFEGPLKKCAD